MTWATFDVDVVIESSDGNYHALVGALADLDAVFDTAHQHYTAFAWARDTGNYAAEAVLRAWVPPSPPPKLR